MWPATCRPPAPRPTGALRWQLLSPLRQGVGAGRARGGLARCVVLCGRQSCTLLCCGEVRPVWAAIVVSRQQACQAPQHSPAQCGRPHAPCAAGAAPRGAASCGEAAVPSTSSRMRLQSLERPEAGEGGPEVVLGPASKGALGAGGFQWGPARSCAQGACCARWAAPHAARPGSMQHAKGGSRVQMCARKNKLTLRVC